MWFRLKVEDMASHGNSSSWETPIGIEVVAVGDPAA